MGPARVPLESPTSFLKKGAGVSPPRPQVEHREAPTATKPPVPRHDEPSLLPPPSKKDFISTNTVDVLRAVPKRPEATILDATHGRGGRQVLEESGLVPKYSKKEDFGRVPDYLQHRKADDTMRKQTHESQLDAMARAGAPRQLSDIERVELLSGLKANWAQLHHDFQGLSVVVDTESKKLRKKKMEEKLAHLEADIQRIERHPVIYVED